MSKPKTERYLRRKCHVCGYIGDVPKFVNDFRRDDIVFWTTSPYQLEINEVEFFAWWCAPCVADDADNI